MAAADVDAGYIAGHLGLDQPVVTALTTEPTVDLVSTLLRAVAAKAHEFDTLYADKLQTDIELENAVRSAETRSQTSKATAEKALKDVEEARKSLKEEGMRQSFPPCVPVDTILTVRCCAQRQSGKLWRMSFSRSRPRTRTTTPRSRRSTTRSKRSSHRTGPT